MEPRYRSTNDQLLAEAASYAKAGNTHEMETILLGVLASGDADERHHEQMEGIKSVGYLLTIPGYISRIKSMIPEQRERQMHLEVYSLLHAASNTSLDNFRQVVEFVHDLKDPLADEALRDFYPSIDYERLSMLELHKERNARNYEYFHNIQAIMRSVVPEVFHQ